MQRYFMLKDYNMVDSNHIEINQEIFHHMMRVMRMAVGDQAYLVFNEKQVIIGEITEINETDLFMKEVAKIEKQSELPINVSLYCGFPKGDKLDLIVQKSTELGAHEIIGFPAETSVVKWDDKKRLKRQERLGKIALEAAEQSHRSIYPHVRLLEKNSEMLKELASLDHLLIAYEEVAKSGEHLQLVETLRSIKKEESLAIIFGPEGGLTPKEVAMFQEYGGKVCSLGPRILRTETAPFYALSAISYQLEMMETSK